MAAPRTMRVSKYHKVAIVLGGELEPRWICTDERDIHIERYDPAVEALSFPDGSPAQRRLLGEASLYRQRSVTRGQQKTQTQDEEEPRAGEEER